MIDILYTSNLAQGLFIHLHMTGLTNVREHYLEEVLIWSMCMMCFCTLALYPKHNVINTRLTCKVSAVILALLTFGVIDNKETQITYGSK